MSNLYCPNCDHLIGSLKPATPPPAYGTHGVTAWMRDTGWEGWQTSGDIYRQYSKWALDEGLEVPTQRAFSSALVNCGAIFKRSNRGRLYSRS
ncbi:hypothetical protein [Paenarthrobacter ilicis]|uniref:hypothetical protein n=1 Tax=Paenarthrobacter ilicis TaxID=43665 RepID=UPI0028D47547|nr:hypothetical protein [Paenarthrobacter ilicis]